MGKTDRVKFSTRRRSKRRFSGNQFTKKRDLNNEESLPSASTTPSSAGPSTVSNQPPAQVLSTPLRNSNFEDIHTNTPKTSDKQADGYRIIDLELLSEFISSSMACPECFEHGVVLRENFTKKQGLCSFLFIECSCGYKKDFYSSKPAGKSFDINRRMIYTMRNLGHGYSGVKKFTTFMNMPGPMTVKNFDRSVKFITKKVEDVAESSMNKASTELNLSSPEKVVDTSVSCDGTWQRRGFSSLNGCYTAMSLDSGKVIDTEVMSRYCKGCKNYEKIKKTNPAKFEKWQTNHVCKLNHSGSAAGMEITGATRIFKRSVEKRKLCYSKFLGDGDSKAFTSIENIYPGRNVEKLECVGHVQKRVGNRCRKLKQTVKGLGGRGRLTDAMIDKLQNYFGIAIRSTSNIEIMKKSIYASLFHVASSRVNNYHTHCPDGKESWCRFKRDRATGQETYKPGPGLPNSVIKYLKPMYEDLSSDSLLKKCIHGKTQNQNEAFNALIWERVPKSVYVSLTQLRFGTYDAVAYYNMGRNSSIEIFKALGMNPGRFMEKHCQVSNAKRLFNKTRKSSEPVRKRRKILRGLKKTKQDSNELNEGVIYEAGKFV